MNIKLPAIILCAALIMAAPGCLGDAAGGSTPVPAPDEEDRGPARRVAEEAEPEAAAAEIYSSFEEFSARKLDDDQIREVAGVEPAYFTEAYFYRSDPRYGLADIAIIKPYASLRENLRAALYFYRDRRVAEFVNYNILGAHGIAQDAIIYDQGEYVIMLMTSDNDNARAVIDSYIPQ